MSDQRGTIDTVLWFWVVVLVALIGAIAIVAAGRGDSMSEVYDDRPDAALPSGRRLTADDLREVRLNTGVRGYRMDEVDALLARLEAELIEREDAEQVRVMTPTGEAAWQPDPEQSRGDADEPYRTPVPEQDLEADEASGDGATEASATEALAREPAAAEAAAERPTRS